MPKKFIEFKNDTYKDWKVIEAYSFREENGKINYHLKLEKMVDDYKLNVSIASYSYLTYSAYVSKDDKEFQTAIFVKDGKNDNVHKNIEWDCRNRNINRLKSDIDIIVENEQHLINAWIEKMEKNK